MASPEQMWKEVKKLYCRQKRRNLAKMVAEPVMVVLFLALVLAGTVFIMYAGCCEAAVENGIEPLHLPILWKYVEPYIEKFVATGGDTQLMLPLGIAGAAPLAACVAGFALRILMILIGCIVIHPGKKPEGMDEPELYQDVIDRVAVLEKKGRDGTVTKRALTIGILVITVLIAGAGAFFCWKWKLPLESIFGTLLIGAALAAMYFLCRLVARLLVIGDSRAYGAAEYARSARQSMLACLAAREEAAKNARKDELLQLLKEEKWEQASAYADGLEFEDDTVIAGKLLLQLVTADAAGVGEPFIALEQLIKNANPAEGYAALCREALELRRPTLEEKAAEQAEVAFDLFLKHDWQQAARTAAVAAAVGHPDAAVVYVAASMQYNNEPSEYKKWFEMVDKAIKKGVSKRFKETSQFTKEIVGQAYYANLARESYQKALAATDPRAKRDLMQAAAAYGSKEAQKYLDDLAAYTRTRISYSPPASTTTSSSTPGSGAYGYPEELGPGYNPVSGEGI